MFTLAILIGLYSYFIFILGLLGLLHKSYIFVLTLFFVSIIVYFSRIYLKAGFTKILKTLSVVKGVEAFVLGIIIVQILVNLIAVLGPELSFDALWYHLTIPRLYLLSHKIFYISGNLLYYSAMPKLTELLYIPVLALGGETLAKLLHFSFGVLSLFALYKISRKFFSLKISLVVSLIFYTNLIVAWESGAAYIDLARTFFEIMAFWAFLNYAESKQKKWLIESAVILGLAISTKLLAIGSLFIFTGLILFSYSSKNKIKLVITNILVYWLLALTIVFPWFILSFVNTDNPVFPFFTELYKSDLSWNLINPLNFISEIWGIFMRSADPISPLYLVFLPFSILFLKKMPKFFIYVYMYSIFSIFVWYITPRTGGGRFILPYLPVLSLLVGFVIYSLQKQVKLSNFPFVLVIIVALITVFYRGLANSKFIPVVLGRETKDQFLSKNLNFAYGDFYDTDGYFKKTINDKDRVLLYGFHNLYYVNFPFIDSSWVKTGDNFNYIAVQNGDVPERFSYWNLIYYNTKTKVKVYSAGGQMWIY